MLLMVDIAAAVWRGAVGGEFFFKGFSVFTIFVYFQDDCNCWLQREPVFTIFVYDGIFV